MTFYLLFYSFYKHFFRLPFVRYQPTRSQIASKFPINIHLKFTLTTTQKISVAKVGNLDSVPPINNFKINCFQATTFILHSHLFEKLCQNIIPKHLLFLWYVFNIFVIIYSFIFIT